MPLGQQVPNQNLSEVVVEVHNRQQVDRSLDARVDVVQPFPTVGLSLKWNSTSDVKTKTFYPLLPSLSCAQDMDKLKNWSADDGAGPSSSGARRATASVTPPTPPSTTAPTSTSGASSTSAATLTSCPSQTTQTTTATASGTAPLRSCSTPTQRGRLSGPMTRSSSSGTSLSARAGPSSFPTAASSADSGLATTESELYKPSAPPCPDNSESSSSGDDYVSAHEDGVSTDQDSDATEDEADPTDQHADDDHDDVDDDDVRVNVAAVQQSGQGTSSQSAITMTPQQQDHQRQRGARGQRGQQRRQRRRRVQKRKREWEASEESLSSVDDEAPFPSRISPRNKRPFEGYTRF